MYKVLIVEEDQAISKLIAEYLEKWEYTAKVSTDFKSIMETFVALDPHFDC